MQLNIKKSCVIWFHTRRQRNQTYPDIVVDNVGLQVATKQKYLGLMFDSTLSWSDQVSRTCQKMFYYLHLSMINHHRHVLPAYLLKLLMESYSYVSHAVCFDCVGAFIDSESTTASTETSEPCSEACVFSK